MRFPPALCALALAGPALADGSVEAAGQVTALGGVAYGLGAVEGRAVASVGRYGEESWQALAWSDLQYWPSGGLLDQHMLELSAWRGRQAGAGLAAMGRGSAQEGWGEGYFAPSLHAALGERAFALARLGPALRLSAAETAPGVGSTALLSAAATPRLGAWLRVDGRLWAAGARLPSALVEADGGVSWSPLPRLALVPAAGLTVTGPGDTAAWRAGIPPSETWLLQGRLLAKYSLTAGFSLQVELAAGRPLGEPGDVAARAMAGATFRAARALRGDPLAPQEIEFVLYAPRARQVQLVGSFNGWSPFPMRRDGEGNWRLLVPLAPGVYEYAYLVDDEPLAPPEAETRRDDGFGGQNGVLVVSRD